MPSNLLHRTVVAETDASSKPKAVANRILGIGIIIFGIVILAAGLITGFEFPTHVRKTLVDEQCVLNKDHPDYDSWESDEHYTRLNRVFFWHINNTDAFLHLGELPKLIQKGPYVYKERRRRLGVEFSPSRVSYKTMVWQEFQPDLTSQECGPQCTENDRISQLNVDFLKNSAKYGGNENYFLSELPGVVEEILENLTWNCCHGKVLNTYKRLGMRSGTLDTAFNALFNAGDFPFGSWLQKYDSDDKLKMYRDFTATEMSALYDVLTDPVRLGVTAEHLRNSEKLKSRCLENRKSSIQSTEPTMPNCGLMQYLRAFNQHNDSQARDDIISGVSSILCQSTLRCMNISSFSNFTTRFVASLRDYISLYLVPLVNYTITQLDSNGLIVQRTHVDLVKGYTIRRRYLGSWQFEKSKRKIKNVVGYLAHHRSLAEAESLSGVMTQATCLEHRDVANNMIVTDYVSRSLGDISYAVRDGRTDFAPLALDKMKTCGKITLNSSRLYFYVPQLHRSLWYTGPIAVTSHDATLERFSLHPNHFPGGRPSKLWDTSRETGYQTALGRAVKTNVTGPLTYNQHSRDIYVDVEPMSGRVWSRNTSFQYYVTIPSSHLNMAARRGVVPEYLDRPLPSHIIEYHQEIVHSLVERHFYKVVRLIRASCGGLIGMSIIAVVVVSVGLFITLVPIRMLGKVAPLPDHEAPVVIS